ncbi:MULTISPECIES: TROVE domain-containing protein [unclassified Kribbella]|uniref:TROVE domain-containing protein n=1 Tax=unclassified Kribbella TaxID=2644121 RepID=UPI003077BDEE
MSHDPLALISTRQTPQDEQADPRQQKNRAGGYTFVQDDFARLHRFLTLGTTGGTYYASERELTQENAGLVVELATKRAAEVVAAVLDISLRGRAPKQNPALFALAAAAKLGDDDGRRAALAAVPLVARTGTHLFLFAGYLQQFGGWGRGTRRAIGNWYVGPDVDSVAYQLLKYRQRDGWSHADLLRLSHPKTTEPVRRELFDWVHRRPADLSGLPLLTAFERIQAATDVTEVVDVIALNRGLSWEMIPDRFLNEPKVWDVLLANGLPQTALLRQLPRLTRLGLLEPLGSWAPIVADQLADAARLKKARVHPVNVLVAQRTYASGRGADEWTPPCAGVRR